MANITNDNLILKFIDFWRLVINRQILFVWRAQKGRCPDMGRCLLVSPNGFWRTYDERNAVVLLFLCALPIKSFTKRIRL